MYASVLKIFEPGRKLLARVVRSPTRLYLLKLDIGRPLCLSTRSTEAAWRWHARYGHLGFQSLRHLSYNDMVQVYLRWSKLNRCVTPASPASTIAPPYRNKPTDAPPC
jgi:hypothetical protein